MDRTHLRPDIAFFFCANFKMSSAINLATPEVSCNAQGAFVIIFFICSHLLNCFRCVCTIVIKQKIAETASNSTSLKKSSLKAANFCCLDVFPVEPSQKFQYQASNSISSSKLGPVFPDYLSVSYGYASDKLLTRLLVLLAQTKAENSSYKLKTKSDKYYIFCITIIKSSKYFTTI